MYSYFCCPNSWLKPRECGQIPSNNLPDFADCDIGYKLEVYPKVPFNYELPDGTIVHIDSIEATLTAKNEINEGDTIKEYFYPYEVTIKVTGNTDKQHAGKSLIFSLTNSQTIISEDGFFISEGVSFFKTNQVVYFSSSIGWIY